MRAAAHPADCATLLPPGGCRSGVCAAPTAAIRLFAGGAVLGAAGSAGGCRGFSLFSCRCLSTGVAATGPNGGVPCCCSPASTAEAPTGVDARRPACRTSTASATLHVRDRGCRTSSRANESADRRGSHQRTRLRLQSRRLRPSRPGTPPRVRRPCSDAAHDPGAPLQTRLRTGDPAGPASPGVFWDPYSAGPANCGTLRSEWRTMQPGNRCTRTH